jgi:hypothetical protein
VLTTKCGTTFAPFAAPQIIVPEPFVPTTAQQKAAFSRALQRFVYAFVTMGRRSGDTQHFQAPAPDKHPPSLGHTKAIGLSARHRDNNTSTKSRGLNKHQQQIEKQHARYPFSQATLWLSVLAFCSFVLAALYWVVYLSSTQP